MDLFENKKGKIVIRQMSSVPDKREDKVRDEIITAAALYLVIKVCVCRTVIGRPRQRECQNTLNDIIGLNRTHDRAARILVHFFHVFLQNNNAKNKQTNKFEFSTTTRTYNSTSLILYLYIKTVRRNGLLCRC